jgi:hypothetical protein
VTADSRKHTRGIKDPIRPYLISWPSARPPPRSHHAITLSVAEPAGLVRIALMGRRFPGDGRRPGAAPPYPLPLWRDRAPIRRPILYPPPCVRYAMPRGIAHIAAYCLQPIIPAVLVVACGMAGAADSTPAKNRVRSVQSALDTVSAPVTNHPTNVG